MIRPKTPSPSPFRTGRRETFILFKPLLAIALSACFFDLLPLDFQHALAPNLVPFEKVYHADIRFQGVRPSEGACSDQPKSSDFVSQVSAASVERNGSTFRDCVPFYRSH
jgi:hypothetical protein